MTQGINEVLALGARCKTHKITVSMTAIWPRGVKTTLTAEPRMKYPLGEPYVGHFTIFEVEDHMADKHDEMLKKLVMDMETKLCCAR